MIASQLTATPSLYKLTIPVSEFSTQGFDLSLSNRLLLSSLCFPNELFSLIVLSSFVPSENGPSRDVTRSHLSLLMT